MQYLRQSTASQVITLGPFVDKADGFTAEGSLTIANTDIRVRKNAATTLANKNSGGATHIASGVYHSTLDATDTDTLGRLELFVFATADALPVWKEFMVLPANIYDSMILGSDLFDVSVTQWLGTAAATPTVAGVPEVDLTHVAGATTDVSTLATSVAAILVDTSTTLQGELDAIEAAVITNAAGADIAADIIALKAETAAILVDTGTTLQAELDAIEADVDAILVDTSTTLQGELDVIQADVAAILVDTAEIGTAGAGLTNINLPNQTMDIVGNITGDLSGSVGSVTGAVGSVASGGITAASLAADAITAAKLHADVTTELQAGLATAANLATVAGFLDTEIAAILADTNELQTDWVDGGRLDLILDARASQTSVDDLPTNAELTTALGTADDAVLAAVATVQTTITKLDDTLEDDGGTFRFTANALEEAPTGGSAPTAAEIADAVWEEAIADHEGTVGSTAESLADAGGSGASAADIADAVWDEATAGHTTSGTFGEQLKTDVDAILVDTIEIGVAGAGLTTRASQVSVDDLPTNAELATALGTADDAVLAQVALVKAKTDNLPTDPADQSLIIAATDAIVTAVGTRAAQASVDDLPTNAELLTALGTADNAVLAAIAALNNLSVANVRTAVGLASANLDTQLGDLPTNAELATSFAAADDAVLAAIAALNNLSQGNIRTAVGLGSANLDTQLGDLPTNTELATALNTALDAILADSIPADGTRPSLRQAAYMALQFLLERSVSGTTLTVNKVDGTTPLMTLTLGDATSPTSLTRAT